MRTRGYSCGWQNATRSPCVRTGCRIVLLRTFSFRMKRAGSLLSEESMFPASSTFSRWSSVRRVARGAAGAWCWLCATETQHLAPTFCHGLLLHSSDQENVTESSIRVDTSVRCGTGSQNRHYSSKCSRKKLNSNILLSTQRDLHSCVTFVASVILVQLARLIIKVHEIIVQR